MRNSISRYASSPLVLGALAVLSLFNTAWAIPITGQFSGALTMIGGNYEEGVGFDGFGLNLELGDHVRGSFRYDSLSGIAHSFQAKVGHLDLVATNLVLGAESFDGHISYFYILGEIDSGLFMSLGLTNGTPVFEGAFPEYLSPSDWFISSFMISADDRPPIEQNSASLGTTNATGSRGHGLVIHTVPEPSSIVLSSLCLLALALSTVARRSSNISRW